MKRLVRFLSVCFIILLLTACGKSPEAQIAEQLELGQRYLLEMKYDEAIVAFEKVIKLDEKNVAAYFGLGQACEAKAEAIYAEDEEKALKLYRYAAKSYEIVLELDPENEASSERLYSVYMELGDKEKLEEVFGWKDSETAAEDADEVPESEEESTAEETEENPEEDIRQLFEQKKLDLVLEKGMLNHRQSEAAYTGTDGWFDNRGIIFARIYDFDSDGADEMLVCYTAGADSEEGKQVLMGMYEYVDGEIAEVTSIPFRGFHENEYSNHEWRLSKRLGDKIGMKATLINVDPYTKYIMCEGMNQEPGDADGLFDAKWVLEYKNQKLDYVSSFTRDGTMLAAGYTGYRMEDGKVTSSEYLYSMVGDGLYSDEETAIKEFFAQNGIRISGCSSVSEDAVFDDSMDCQPLFKFSNNGTMVNDDPEDLVYEAILTTN